MARGEQLGRQWKILNILINSKTGKTVTDIAGRIDCHKRTVYRDLEALQLAGFPIYDEKQNGRSVWYILESGKNIAMPMSLTELMALYFGRDFLGILKNTVFHESLKSLSNKLKETVPDNYKIFLESFEKNIKVRQQPYKYKTMLDETIHTINEAIEKQKCIDISYLAVSTKTLSERRVAPYMIWLSDGTFYITGHCFLRGETRTFALDRVKNIIISEESFKKPNDFKNGEYLQSSFGVFHGETAKVKIWFSPDAAKYVKEKKWHDSQKIYEQKDGSIIFRVETAGINDIKIWVMSWGAKAKVLEPQALKEKIKIEIDLLTNLYQ